MNQENLVSFLWSIPDLLRGTVRQSQYARLILPVTILRRLECVLEPNRDKVLKAAEKRKDSETLSSDDHDGAVCQATIPLRFVHRVRFIHRVRFVYGSDDITRGVILAR